MSLKEMSSVVRRLEFVKLALKAQESMTQLCRRFGISRKRGYKWRGRFEQEGQRGLRDRSRRPHRSPRRLTAGWIRRIRRLRRRHRSWGAKKLRARLRREHPNQKVPSVRTVAKWLSRLKLSRRRRRSPKGPRLSRPGLTVARRSNQVWTVDFKGWFRTQDGQRIEPLTVRDLFSRYLLTIRLLRCQNWRLVRRICLRLFRQNGYPDIIRVDNGQPFGSTGALGLSRLSAWWTALGIRVEFIAPGHPEQNGGHEQMHRVLKAETTRPTSRHRRAQQRRTDRWSGAYNQIRPHEALGQRVPAEVYRRQPTRPRKAVLSYPERWEVRRVRSNGEIKWRGRKRFVGEAFVGYPVGLKLRSQGRYAVGFAGLLIGELWDSDAGGMRPAQYVRRYRERCRG
jgi:transposase InsO family protein